MLRVSRQASAHAAAGPPPRPLPPAGQEGGGGENCTDRGRWAAVHADVAPSPPRPPLPRGAGERGSISSRDSAESRPPATLEPRSGDGRLGCRTHPPPLAGEGRASWARGTSAPTRGV